MSELQPVRASAPGVEMTACPHGAHLTSWRTADVERLWMSPVSRCGEAPAIRGGVPVLFPQFGTFGHLPKHGFARTSLWRHVSPAQQSDGARIAFELNDSVDTLAVWPHPFRAGLEILATPTELTIRLSVTNLDDHDATFTAGLHTYFAVADPRAWISGLGGCLAWNGDSTEDPVFAVPVGDRLATRDEQDRVIRDAPAEVVLHDEVLGDLIVTAEGFPDRVVWNPGAGHQLPDVPAGLEAQFVCIEPVVLNPVVLSAGRTWRASSTVTVA